MSEAEKTTMDEARALVSDRALWPLVRDFLWDFAPQIHASWLADVFGHETADARRGQVLSPVSSLSSSIRVKKFILSSLGVKPFFHDFPRDDMSRLALLDGSTLDSIVKWLGALACADELRRVTSGATVRELKAALPGVYPEVFSFTAYFTGLGLAAENAKDVKPPEKVAAAGLGLLFALSGAWPAPVAERLKLKLPRNLCDLCGPFGEKERPAAGVAVKKLLKLKFPEAYSLCCS